MRSNNELFHSVKGSSRPGHKYISRTMKNGKWAYKYANNKAGGKLKKKVEVTFDEVKLKKSNDPLNIDNQLFEGYKNGEVSKEYIQEKSSNGDMSYTYEEAERRMKAIDDQKKRQARRQEAIRSKKTAELKAKGRKFVEDLKQAGII